MRVVKNYLYNASYQLLNLILPLVTAHYLSRVIGTKGVGINSFTYSVVSYFLLFALLGIDVYGRKLVAEKRDDSGNLSRSFWQIWFFHLVTTSLAIIFYLLFVCFFGGNVKGYLYWQALILVASIFDVSWFFIGLEDFAKTVIRNIFVRIIMVILIFILITKKQDLWILIALTGVTQIVGNLSLWPYLINKISKPKMYHLDFFVVVLPSLALFIPNLATQIYLQFNKTLLGILGNLDQVGLFNYPDQFVKITLALVTATGAVMLPNMSHKFSKGDKKGIISSLTSSMNFVIGLSVLLSVGLFVTAPAFFGWLLPSDFSGSIIILQILSLTIVLIGISNVLGFQFMIPTNRINVFTASVIAGAIVNLSANFVLIPRLQAVGTAIATLLAEMVVVAMQIFYLRHDIDLRKIFNQVYKYFISGILLAASAFVISKINLPDLIKLTLQSITGLAVYTISLIILRAPLIQQARKILKIR